MILAQVVALVLLGFAPVALVIGIFPGAGHDVLPQLAGQARDRGLHQGALLAGDRDRRRGVGRAGGATDSLGFLFAFGLQTIFFWAIFLYRKQITAPAGRRDHRALPRRAAAAETVVQRRAPTPRPSRSARSPASRGAASDARGTQESALAGTSRHDARTEPAAPTPAKPNGPPRAGGRARATRHASASTAAAGRRGRRPGNGPAARDPSTASPSTRARLVRDATARPPGTPTGARPSGRRPSRPRRGRRAPCGSRPGATRRPTPRARTRSHAPRPRAARAAAPDAERPGERRRDRPLAHSLNRPLARRRPAAPVRDRRRDDHRRRRRALALIGRARPARPCAPTAAARPLAAGLRSTPARRTVRRRTRRRTPQRGGPPATSGAASPRTTAAAKRAARRFLSGYLPYTYGRRRAGAIRGRQARLRAAARRAAAARSAARTRRQPRVVLLQIDGAGRHARDGDRAGRTTARAATRVSARARARAARAGWSATSGADADAAPVLAAAAALPARAQPRRARAARRAWRSLGVVVFVMVMGVLGAVFGLQPAVSGRRSALAARARGDPARLPAPLHGAGAALRDRPVDPRRDRRRSRPTTAAPPRRACARA